ncbi:MAG: ubiquitin carboxyl-terminal hydrolase [archaeon]|nr:ubiquitin carboxyl-terminal hydrolase [archaeon]
MDKVINNLKLTKDSLKCLVGIKNLGNTCYMNAVLQSLSNIYEYSSYFLNYKFPEDTHNDILYQFTLAIKKLHYGKEKLISISKFRDLFIKKFISFSGNGQEDSEEFLLKLLDHIHEELNSINTKEKVKNNYDESTAENSGTNSGGPLQDNGEKELLKYFQLNQSIVSDLFTGQYKNSVKCCKCNKVSYNFEIFINLSLPISIINKVSFYVYFTYFDITKGTIRIPINLDIDSNIFELRKIISKLLHIDIMSFIICSVENFKIIRLFNLCTKIRELSYVFHDLNQIMILCIQFDSDLYSKNVLPNFNINLKRRRFCDLNIRYQRFFYSRIDPVFMELYSIREIFPYKLNKNNINSSYNNKNGSSMSLKYMDCGSSFTIYNEI